jgi:hypothetical protein
MLALATGMEPGGLTSLVREVELGRARESFKRFSIVLARKGGVSNIARV